MKQNYGWDVVPDKEMDDSPKLADGDRVAVVGGGPAGSFFAYFLLDMAARAGLQLELDIYEPRDFLKPGPIGCNMCAGIVSETLVQNLAAEGINLPPTVVQRGIGSYQLHMDVGSVRIDTPVQEKRIASVYRGAGPKDLKESRWIGLDGHLLSLAMLKGAKVINERVTEVSWDEGRPKVGCRQSGAKRYDLLVVTTGVNSRALGLFEGLDLDYRPPKTTKTYLREYYLGAEKVERVLGDAIQVFLLDIPHLEFGMLIPKGDYITLCLLGEDIDKDLIQKFIDAPEVQRCLPADLDAARFSCNCSPRINTTGAKTPFGDRIVFIGDCGATRLFKDGIGSAYRSAKAAASTAVFQGISARDFKKYYQPICRDIENDNLVGKFIFWVVGYIQKLRFAREAMLRMIVSETDKPGALRRMSTVQWDMYTGSSSYNDILRRILHPAFILRLVWDTLVSLSPGRSPLQSHPETLPIQEENEKNGTLGKHYRPGELIIREGDEGHCMYVVQKGQVAIVQNRDGHEQFLGVRGEGEVLGEMAIFESVVHGSSVRALSEAWLLTVDKGNFLRRIHEDPSLAYHLFGLLSRRLRELSQEVVALNQEIDRLREGGNE